MKILLTGGLGFIGSHTAVELLEGGHDVLQVIHGQAVAKEMQQGIQHGGAMAAGQDKAVPVQPLWIFRIVAHVPAPQLVSNWRTAHRQARMAGLCLLNHLGSQNTDSIYTGVLNITQR